VEYMHVLEVVCFCGCLSAESVCVCVRNLRVRVQEEHLATNQAYLFKSVAIQDSKRIMIMLKLRRKGFPRRACVTSMYEMGFYIKTYVLTVYMCFYTYIDRYICCQYDGHACVCVRFPWYCEI